MFGASMSELYLLIKSLINIERRIDLCVSDDKVLPIEERPQNGHKLHDLNHNEYSNRMAPNIKQHSCSY